jgi:hypothetical protein
MCQAEESIAFLNKLTARLRKNRVPWDLQRLWVGHANKDVTARYAEQLKENRTVAEKSSRERRFGVQVAEHGKLVGLRGLPKQQKSQWKKVA